MASGDATLKTDLQATLWTFHSFFMIKQSCLEDRSAGSGRPTATATPHRPPHPLRAARHPPLLAHLSAAMSSGQPNGPRRRLYSAWITGICRQRQRPTVTASGKALERAYARHGDGGDPEGGGGGGGEGRADWPRSKPFHEDSIAAVRCHHASCGLCLLARPSDPSQTRASGCVGEPPTPTASPLALSS